MKIRKSDERGLANHGWLKSRHTFSFANYYDPAHMGFRALRVINEDRVDGGGGFPPHPHRDMEIISYVLDGALEHQDSMGNGSVIRPGDVQRMSAGTGVVHSEYNHSPADQVHFLQIWIQPDQRGVEPGYEQKHFTVEERKNALRVVASPDGRDGSVRIHQDASLAVALLDADHTVEHTLADGRHAWVHVARGAVRLGDVTLSAGDAAAFTEATTLSLTATEAAEVLVFDLA